MNVVRSQPKVAFLFDLDGILVDSGYQHVLAWRQALETEGMCEKRCRVHRAMCRVHGAVQCAPFNAQSARAPHSTVHPCTLHRALCTNSSFQSFAFGPTAARAT